MNGPFTKSCKNLHDQIYTYIFEQLIYTFKAIPKSNTFNEQEVMRPPYKPFSSDVAVKEL